MHITANFGGRQMISRRTLLAASTATILSPPALFAKTNPSYAEYDFVDIYNPPFVRGGGNPSEQDVQQALLLAKSMPTKNSLTIMKALAAIKTKGTTGEYFNARWRQVANPLIVKFFHDIGFAKTPYPGDCTPWCAATVSWCLQRSGLKLPDDPASSERTQAA
jgi:hypothetical protein